jgi:hypothetical protein
VGTGRGILIFNADPAILIPRQQGTANPASILLASIPGQDPIEDMDAFHEGEEGQGKIPGFYGSYTPGDIKFQDLT